MFKTRFWWAAAALTLLLTSVVAFQPLSAQEECDGNGSGTYVRYWGNSRAAYIWGRYTCGYTGPGCYEAGYCDGSMSCVADAPIDDTYCFGPFDPAP